MSARVLGERIGRLCLTAVAAVTLGPSLFPLPCCGADAADIEELARSLVTQSGIQRGVCAIVTGEDNDSLPIDLAKASELFVHVRCRDAAAAQRLREAAQQAGLGIDRFAVEQGDLRQLPYADNIIDVLIVRTLQDVTRGPTQAEMLRVVRPRGRVFVGRRGADAAAREWSENSQDLRELRLAGGSWTTFQKRPLAGAGNWSHWEHGPDNNPVSEDTAIKAPYLTQYLADPMYIAMPAITTAAAGRTFLAIGHIAHHEREWDTMVKLIASNGYNGTVLWERKLPEGYLVHRSAFVATEDAFYLIDGERALVLDPETGAERAEIRVPGVEGHWKWMVLVDHTLYVLTGDKDEPAELVKGDRAFGGWSWADLSRGYYAEPQQHIPWGFGHTLAAYDLATEQTLWVHKEGSPIDARAMAMGQDRVTIYCPEAHFRCLDVKTGKVLWTNDDPQVRQLIEQPGKGLTSTPGFRTACMTLFTPDALIVQGQTRNNVVALSTHDGYLLWSKQKVTNNPNAIYLDGNVILGVGERGSHVAVNPVSGETVKDLNFLKRACTRLTACSDSLFVRGEGTLRYDRETGKVLVDGAARPACNDGALPANGLLYVGPWQCDCNLSLIGRLARCSAGDFRFDYVAANEDRLKKGDDVTSAAPLDVADNDWPTYRADDNRSASTSVRIPGRARILWQYTPQFAAAPTPPTAAGGLIFTAGEDGLVKALKADSGDLAWSFATNSPIKYPPTIADGRVYFGSGDGYAYCLAAATGRELWRFRAAPIERHLMVYGTIASTWPVNSGVLVRDGAAYFGAGMIDSDGTYLYAVDAKTGELRWQNNSSGHLSSELRKGVSIQGNMTVDGDRLLLAGGNQVSPAPFDLASGKCLADEFDQGQPKANNGRFAGMFLGEYPIVGGRILYSAAENVSTKGSYQLDTPRHGRLTLNFGGIPPAWNEQTVALVNYQNGALTCLDAKKVASRVSQGLPAAGAQRDSRQWTGLTEVLLTDGASLWTSDLGEPNKFEVVSMVVGPNAIVAALQFQQKFRSQPQWFVVAFNREDGRPLWRQEVSETPLPDGLLVNRDGRIAVTMTNGKVLCLGAGG